MIMGNGILASKCKLHEIRLVVEFTSHLFIKMIKSCIIRTELTLASNPPDYTIINNYIYKYFINYDYDNSNNFIKKNENLENTQFVKIKQNQYSGIELLQNLSCFKIRLSFNHYVDRFFIYFQDLNDKSIYWNTQQFETIKFIANGYEVLELDYTTLLYENSKSVLGYELPKGIFEIKWNTIKWKNLSRIDNLTVILYDLIVPSNVGFAICAESINSLQYYENQSSIVYSN